MSRAAAWAGANGGALTYLSLNGPDLVPGTTVTLNIGGATAGSTLTASGLPSGWAINSAARTISGPVTAALDAAIVLTETLAGKANSPRQHPFKLKAKLPVTSYDPAAAEIARFSSTADPWAEQRGITKPPSALKSLYSQLAGDITMPTRAGMTPATRLVLGTLVYEATDPGATPSAEAAAKMQEHLLWAYHMARGLGGTALDNIMLRPCVMAVFPYGYYQIRDALVYPPHVHVECLGKVIRAAQPGGVVSASWDGTYHDSLRNIYRPAIIMTPTSMMGRTQLKCDPTSNATDAGSGVFAGKNWAVASVTIEAGSGFSVGDKLVAVNPDARAHTTTGLPFDGNGNQYDSVFKGFAVTVDTVDGSGKPTASTITNKGSYAFPFRLQQKAWKNMVDLGVFDGDRVKMVSPSGNVAWATVTWEPDFVGGRYRTSNNLVGDTYIDRLRIHGVGLVNDATYGPQFALAYNGLNHDFGEVQTVGGYFGFDAYFANDIRGSRLNTVLCATGISLFSVSSFECPAVVTDSCRDADLRMDRSTDIKLDITSFFATGNSGIFPNVAGSPLRIGSQSSGTSQYNDNCTIRASLKDRGPYNGAAQAAAVLQQSRNCTFDIEVSNGNRNSGAPYFMSAVGSIGTNLDASVTIRGRADKMTGALFSGAGLTAGDSAPRCNVDFWDAQAQAKIGWGGRYDIKMEGVPVDGSSGTGAGKAAKGSKVTDVTNANEYINGGTLASPTWKLLTRAA